MLIANSQGIKKSRTLMNRIWKHRNICKLVDNTLMVNTRDEELFALLGIDVDTVPLIYNIIHGISIEYTDDLKNATAILEWVRAAAHGKVKQVNE